jgi:hypothetical protein
MIAPKIAKDALADIKKRTNVDRPPWKMLSAQYKLSIYKLKSLSSEVTRCLVVLYTI